MAKQWEELFDRAVGLAVERRFPDALGMLRKIRSWQRRKSRYSLVNNDWHTAEVLWLEGVLCERLGQTARARRAWQRLARAFSGIARCGYAFVPYCARCAERRLGFAPSWVVVARQLGHLGEDREAAVTAFRQLALATEDGAAGLVLVRSPRVEPVAGERSASEKPGDSAAALLRPKRDAIRRLYRSRDRPATVVELSDQYLTQDPADGMVWAWYGRSLADLGRYADAETALQTARGLVATDDLRGIVLVLQGDLEEQRGCYDRAERCYRDAAECDTGSDWPLIKLGRLLFRSGSTAEAEDAFRRAVEKNDSSISIALCELGLVLRGRGALFEARRVLRQSLALDQDDATRASLSDVERVIRLQTKTGHSR